MKSLNHLNKIKNFFQKYNLWTGNPKVKNFTINLMLGPEIQICEIFVIMTIF